MKIKMLRLDEKIVTKKRPTDESVGHAKLAHFAARF
jgi:hypothetical protein